MKAKVLLQILLFSTLILIAPRAQENNRKLTGYELSELVNETLISRDYATKKQRPVPSFNGNFPNDIIVTIEKDQQEAGKNTNKSGINSIIFAFSQDFFVSDPEFMFSFLEMTKEKKLPYTVKVLFSTDSEAHVLFRKSKAPGGTENYADRIYDVDSSCAIVISDEQYSPKVIVNKGGGNISPLWLIKILVRTTDNHNRHHALRGTWLYLTKSDLFRADRRVSSFLQNEIPCAGFTLGHSQTDLEILSDLEDELVSERRSLWDKHYSHINIGNGFWLNEAQLIFIFMIFSFFIISTLCFTSFTSSSKNEAILRDFSRTWYLIPAYILVIAICLFLFEKIFIFTRANPVIYFALKVFSSIFASTVIATLQIHHKIKVSLTANTLHRLIICGTNLLIFSTMDISLMSVFFAEYMIVFILRRWKNTITNIICIILMVLPYAQILMNIYIFADRQMLSEVINCSFSENIFLSFIITPFVFQWIKILLVSNVLEDNKKKDSLVHGIVFSGFLTIFYFAMYYTAASIIRANFRGITLSNIIHVTQSKSANAEIEATVQDEENFDMITRTLKIKSLNGKQIIRCIVSIETPDGTPIYECNFNYSMESGTKVNIEIPDRCENEIEIVYSADYESSSIITIETYVEEEEYNALYEKRTIRTIAREPKKNGQEL